MRIANKLVPRFAILTALAIAAGAPLHAAGSWCGNPSPPCLPDDPKNHCYQPPKPDQRCEPYPCGKCTKSPCFVGSGVYINSATDLELPTPGFTLSASRSYESTRTIDGPMGYGWTSSLTARLYYATFLLQAPNIVVREADITMPDGAQYRFSENANGTFTPPLGRYDRLVRNQDGSFDLTIQRTMSKFHFGSEGSLVTMTDDFGNALLLTYDAAGNLERIADQAGSDRYIDVYWGADGRISNLVDSAGRQITYTYDSEGLLTATADPLGRITHYTYSPGKYVPLLASIVDNWGRNVTSITFDSKDRVSSYTDHGETYTYSYSYQGDPLKTAKSDSAGNTWIFVHTTGGLVADSIAPAGSGSGSRHTDYNSNGSLLQTTNELGIKTAFSYETSTGRLLSQTMDFQGPLAVRWEYTYDAVFPGKISAITPRDPSTGAVNPLYAAQRYEHYDSTAVAPGALRRVMRVRSDGQTLDTLAMFEYDGQGRIVSEENGAGEDTYFSYNAAGDLTSVNRPANNSAGARPTTFYEYDNLGRVMSKTDSLGNVTQYSYDAVGRILIVVLPTPSAEFPLSFAMSRTYDTFDNVSGLLFDTTTDANARAARRGLDVYNRVRQFVDPLGGMTNYGYTRDLLTSVEDANANLTSYAYDSRKRLTTTVFPDGAAESYTYYPDGLLKSVRDRSDRTLSYAYDRMGRIASKTYPNASSIAYSYLGPSLSRVDDMTLVPTDVHLFSYDDAYRLASETQGSRGTIAYSYGASDRLASYSVAGGESASYSYFPDGSISAIQWSPLAGEFSFTYDLSGKYEAIVYPNGQRRQYTYDELGRVVHLENLDPAAQDIATYVYSYDRDAWTGMTGTLGPVSSVLTQIPSQGLSNAITKYAYDADYRLIRVDYPEAPPFNGEMDQWTYDLIDNRLSSSTNGQVRNYNYEHAGTNANNWNRILSDGARTYASDANGSITSISSPAGTEEFTWDDDHRASLRLGADATSHVYDFLGRRTGTTRGILTAEYLFKGDSAIRVGGSQAEARLVGPLRDELLALEIDGTVYYATLDDHDSVVALSDSEGNVRFSATFDAWGATREASGDLSTSLGYIGRESDTDAYWINDSRYYRPDAGRFLQEDPGGIDVSSARQLLAMTEAARSSPRSPGGFWQQVDPASVAPSRNQSTRSYPYGGNNPIASRDPGGRYWVYILEAAGVVFLGYHLVEYQICQDEFVDCREKRKKRDCGCIPNSNDGAGIVKYGTCAALSATSCRQESECYWDIKWLPLWETFFHYVPHWIKP